MSFKNAQQSRLLIGPLHYSGYATKVDFGAMSDALDVTTLLDTAFKYILGQETSTAQVDLIADTDATAGGLWSNVTTWKSTQPSPLLFGPQGIGVGDTVFLTGALLSSFTVTSPAADAVKGSLDSQTEGLTDIGVVLETLTAVTADGNGTARDNGAATSNGGIAQIHVTAFSGLTNNIVTIEHSVDGSTSWATLATFATYTGITSERVVVAPGTTVRRYLRVVDDVTGTGTTTRAVAFSRR